MTFKFDPDFDYYELFEACMGFDEAWQAMADDPEDYDEFIEALKSGKFVPKD